MLYNQQNAPSSAESREQPVAGASPRVIHAAKKEKVKNLWLPVPRMTLNDLPDLALLIRHGNKPCRPDDSNTGVRVQVNDVDVALFRFGNQVYATMANCPHAGGPLEVGDIEDLDVRDPCIVCPYHKYKFRILSGRNSFPNQPEFNVETYPVRVKHGGRLFVGFASLSKKCFEEQEF